MSDEAKIAAIRILTQARQWDLREISAIYGIGWAYDSVAEDMLRYSPNIAFATDGEPVAIGGLYDSDERLEAWLIATPRFPEIASAITRKARAALNACRLPVTCRSHAENRPAHRWLEYLGFRRARDLPAFGLTREDHVEFAFEP